MTTAVIPRLEVLPVSSLSKLVHSKIHSKLEKMTALGFQASSSLARFLAVALSMLPSNSTTVAQTSASTGLVVCIMQRKKRPKVSAT